MERIGRAALLATEIVGIFLLLFVIGLKPVFGSFVLPGAILQAFKFAWFFLFIVCIFYLPRKASS